MARAKKCVLKVPSVTAMNKQAATLGLDPSVISQLIAVFGPALVNLILQWWAKNKSGNLSAAAATNPVIDILVTVLTQDKDTVLGWIEAGESSLYDAMVAIVGAKAAGVAILLQQYRSEILAEVDTLDSSVLDQIIAALQANA